MLSAQSVFARLNKTAGFRNFQFDDFRQVVYAQDVQLAASPASTQLLQSFPGGAVILGVTASAVVGAAVQTLSTATAVGQASRNRHLFGLLLDFTTGDRLTQSGNPVSADALLGGGESDIFPQKEIVILPNQSINVTIKNYTSVDLWVQIVFHCLSYRFGS